MSENDNDNQNDEQNQNDGKGAEDVAGLKTALQSERDARKQADKLAKDLQKRLTDIENSGKSESDKLAARLEALEKDYQAKTKALAERDARDNVKDAAKKAGAPDADLVYRVLKSDLEYDEDGEVTNLKDLIDDLKTTTPHLFKAKPGPGDAGNGTRQAAAAGGMNRLIRQAAGYE